MMAINGPGVSQALSNIARAETVAEIHERVMSALQLIGVNSAYFVAPLTADPRIGRLLTNIGVNSTWERHYRSRLHLIDPLPNYSLTRSEAFFWPDELDKSKLSSLQKRYLRLSGRFGIGKGIGVACYGPNGRSGFLGAVWDKKERPDTEFLQWVHTVGQSSFQRYCQLIRSDDELPRLSNRELQVLSWMCEGKSNSVIAQILEISRSSVDMYVRRIFGKLEVGDRTAACLRAFSLGLIVTGDYHRLIEQAKKRNPDQAIR